MEFVSSKAFRFDQSVSGLNTIRFLAALCVAFRHGALFPVEAYLPKTTTLGFIINAVNGVAFNGVAAVLLFFLISGFCIHNKSAHGAPVDAATFLARRLIRVVIPLIAAFVISIAANATEQLQGVLWSLYCEIIYYALYPVFFFCFRRFGIWNCIGVSSAASFLLIAANWDTGYIWQFPVYVGSIVALPAWLLGCAMAERVAAGRELTFGNVWLWRAAGCSYAVLSNAYFFHAPVKIGYPALLAPFVIYAYFWLLREISHFRANPPPVILEQAGEWSYSLYLMHQIALVTAVPLVVFFPPVLAWAIILAVILALSYVFYEAVERPARDLANTTARAFTSLRVKSA